MSIARWTLMFIIFIPCMCLANTSESSADAYNWVGKCSDKLNKEVLQESLARGTEFLLNNQNPVGNFAYEYKWVRRTYTPGDSQVRQAGALWGLTLIYQIKPDPKLASAIEKSLAFFEKHSKLNAKGNRYIIYLHDRVGSTGTVALVTLALIDYLRVAEKSVSHEKRAHYTTLLQEYLGFLIEARKVDGLWYKNYRIDTGVPFGQSTPYFDGEALLALVKAARYSNHGRSEDALKTLIIQSANAGYQRHIKEALAKDPDSSTTKGYYQWSSMVFYELSQSGWPDTKKYGDHVIFLANWMIDVHRTLERTRNTAYAYEGIVHAFALARQRNDTEHIQKFACTIEKGLEKLTSWQVGGPIPNMYISSNVAKSTSKSIGGIQNHRKEDGLRIDVTQHQMHAVILALKYFYS